MASQPHGIVTLADAAYFAGLIMLHQSVRESWPVPVICFDAGLLPEQIAHAHRLQGLTIAPLPETGLMPRVREAFANAAPLGKKIKRVWPLWICPALIAAAPFQRVFWIDCDAFVLRDLEGLFGLLDDGPVFTRENNAPEHTPNPSDLYRLLPIGREFDPLEPRVNAGVSGWDLERDEHVLRAYMHVVARACDDPEVAAKVSWHDQGALIWAIQTFGLEDRVQASTAWNLCVRNTPVFTDPQPWGPDFLSGLRVRLPKVNILHWNGVPPPWTD